MRRRNLSAATPEHDGADTTFKFGDPLSEATTPEIEVGPQCEDTVLALLRFLSGRAG